MLLSRKSYSYIILVIKKQTLNNGHTSVADTMNNIASVYYSKGESEKAFSQYRDVLKMYKLTLPENHPSIGDVCNNLGTYLFKIISRITWNNLKNV